MTRPCGTCHQPINDWTDGRYTFRGDNAWYCSEPCANQSMVVRRG